MGIDLGGLGNVLGGLGDSLGGIDPKVLAEKGGELLKLLKEHADAFDSIEKFVKDLEWDGEPKKLLVKALDTIKPVINEFSKNGEGLAATMQKAGQAGQAAGAAKSVLGGLGGQVKK